MNEDQNKHPEHSCEEVLSDPERGRLVFDRKAILRRPLQFLRVSGPLLTAHHPFCSHFEGHTFTLAGRKWCIGCFFNTLSFFSALVILAALWSGSPTLIDRNYLLVGGGAAVLVSLLTSALGLTENKIIKGVSKLLLGGGFASVVFSILIAGGSIVQDIDLKVIAVLTLYLPVITVMNARRLREIETDCSTCEYKMRWSKCPGFMDIICRYVEEGFLRPTDKTNS